MTQLQRGKWTHQHDGDVVVFMVGMRVNTPRRVRTWWRSFSAMPRMLRELYAQPATGFLGATSTINGRGALVISYWRSLEELLAYAHAQDHEHRPAWAAFNASARQSAGVVGIWHETFVVPAGGHESLYVDMPRAGIVAATSPIQVTAPRDTARSRMVAASGR